MIAGDARRIELGNFHADFFADDDVPHTTATTTTTIAITITTYTAGILDRHRRYSGCLRGHFDERFLRIETSCSCSWMIRVLLAEREAPTFP